MIAGRAISLSALVLLMPLSAEAASFNCRTADRPDEVLICQNPRLSALDEEMSSLYFTLRNSLSGRERRRLEESQQAWLDSRMGCGRDLRCLQFHYERRISQLRDY